MDHRNITLTWEEWGSGYFYRDTITLQFCLCTKRSEFLKEKRRLSSFIISKTLDWGANENTEKLPITRLTCHALIYGARSVLKTKITLALTTRCQKFRGQFHGKTNESGNKSINTETR